MRFCHLLTSIEIKLIYGIISSPESKIYLKSVGLFIYNTIEVNFLFDNLTVLTWIRIKCKNKFNKRSFIFKKNLNRLNSYLVGKLIFLVNLELSYSTLSNPPLNDWHFPKFVRGTRQRWFFIFFNFQKFSKIFKNFTIFILKMQLEGCFIIISSYLNRKNKQK